jgi:hypothetical protein
MLGGLCLVFLSACSEPPQTSVPDGAPVTADTNADKQPAPLSAPPQDSLQEQEPVAAETRTLESLDLTLDRVPAALPDSPGFGAAPDSGWLDEGSALDEPNSDGNTLLPDLFDGNKQEKPVDIKGGVLIDKGSSDFSDSLDGAEVSIEIKTD